MACGDAFWGRREVAARVAQWAELLATAGLRRGEVVLYAADAPVALTVLQHALARLGAGLLPYPPDLSAADLDTLAAGVGAEWHWRSGALRAMGDRTQIPAGAASPTLLVRTSGSSGTPKVVMLTAGQLVASAVRANRALDLRHGDEWLCVLPLHHIGGLAIGWRCGLAGATVRFAEAGAGLALPGASHGLPKPGFDASALAETLARYPVTHVSLVPTMLARLLDVMPKPPASLRAALVGGQALHPALARRAADAGWPLYVSYGMSETGSMIAAGRWQVDATPGARVGQPLPGVELDCAGPDEPPRALRLRAPMLMAGYGSPLRRPGVGLADGWLTTSDLCRLDRDGALRVFGRADDLVVIGGEQVCPSAVEAKLASALGLDELVVVAVPHPVWGATLAACWSGAADPDQVEAWCRSELPARERPRIFRRLSRLPTLASGKPNRAALVRAVSRPASAASGAD